MMDSMTERYPFYFGYVILHVIIFFFLPNYQSICDSIVGPLLANLDALLAPEVIQGRVCISLGTNLSAEGKCGEASGVEAAFINMTHIHLHATVILGSDQLVGPRAAHTQIQINEAL